jgi:cytidylate kinase
VRHSAAEIGAAGGEAPQDGGVPDVAAPLVLAVDGPSGSGKSSAAKGAAMALGLRYLDTGAMYRAVTWWMLEHDIDLADTEAITKHATCLTVDVSTDPGAERVVVDGTDVTASIRQRRVSNAVSLVAAIPGVREHLIAAQRQIIADASARYGGIVAEGRDIGTVVAPHAPVKVFLTASEHARAERRTAELAGQADADRPPSAEVTREEQALRDRLDAPQTRRAADAIEVDATLLGLDDVIGRIVELAAAHRPGR